MAILTLLTDFGLQDGYVGIMKGVIWGIAPAVQIADLSHAIPAQDVLQGALTLQRAVPYFPGRDSSPSGSGSWSGHEPEGISRAIGRPVLCGSR